MAVQRPGEGGFGVEGGHADGVGDLLDLGLQADHVRGDPAEADAGGDGRCGLVRGLEFGLGGFDGGVQGVDHLVGDGDRLAGRRVAQRRQAGVALGLGRGGEDLGVADLGGSGFLRRVGDFPGRVVGRGGVGVQGVQGEVGAGVAEVVLLPPPGGQPPADFPGGQVGAGGQRVDLPGAAGLGGDPAGDLPQGDCLPLARPVAGWSR